MAGVALGMKTLLPAFAFLAFCSLIAAAPVPAPPKPADVQAAQTLLKNKGLTRSGALYLLEGEAKLPEELRVMRAAKFRVDQNAAQRAKLEKAIEAANETVLQSSREMSEATSNASREKNRVRYNELVAQQDAARTRALEAIRERDFLVKDLNKLGDPRDDYVTLLLNVSARMEKMSEQYAALAEDQEVRDALAVLNASGGLKVRLGPSPRMLEELPAVRKQRDLLKDAVIKFRSDSGTPTVPVTINDKLNLLMTFDSGASSVSLTSEAAKELGLRPGPDDPVIEATGADGKATKVQVVTLKSVRLGQFVIGDVECIIYPPSVKGSNLLGGTFLRNFVYRMDLAAGEIHMTQVAGKAVVPEMRAEKNPTTRPAAPGRAVVLDIKAIIDGSDIITVTPGWSGLVAQELALAFHRAGEWAANGIPKLESNTAQHRPAGISQAGGFVGRKKCSTQTGRGGPSP
jgi:clan AA aspartic protease (TIGR02281 family)